MNQNKRFCTQQGHDYQKVNQVCTYRWCDESRWCCPQCLKDDIHRHSMPNSNHIMNQGKLYNKIKQDIENLKQEQLDSRQGIQLKNLLIQLMKETLELEKLIINFRENLQKQLNISISDEDNFKLQLLMQKVEEQNFIQLNDDDINKMLNIKQYQFNYDVKLQLQDAVDKIKLQLIILENKVKEYQENNLKEQQENINNKIIDFKSRKYDIQKIHEVNNMDYISSFLISNNLKYLVYKVQNITHIYDIKMKKPYKSIEQKNALTQFQFTTDSTNLFAGDDEGFVYGYFVSNSFKTFYKQKIHQNIITQIIIQKYYLITASRDATIIKTNIIKKNQIFILAGHSSQIISIDYDFQKDVLISTSDDRSIIIWDCLNQSILIAYEYENRQFKSIQLINNKQDILCHSGLELVQIFSIDYQNKKLVQTFNNRYSKRIFELQQVNNDQNLLLICNKYCKLLNNQGELILKIKHNIDFQIYPRYKPYRKQLDNLNYIILSDIRQLHLLQVKEQN